MLFLLAAVHVLIFGSAYSQCSPSPARNADNLIPTNPGVQSFSRNVPSQSQVLSFSSGWEWHADDAAGKPLTTSQSSFTMTKSQLESDTIQQAWGGMFFPTTANNQSLFQLWSSRGGTTVEYKISLKFQQAPTNRDDSSKLPTAHIVAFIYSKSKLAQYNSLFTDDSSFPNTPGSKWFDYTQFGNCRDTDAGKSLCPTLTVALRSDSIAAGKNTTKNLDKMPIGIDLGKTNATTPQTLETRFTIIGNNKPPCTDCVLGIRVIASLPPQDDTKVWWNIGDVTVESEAIALSMPVLQGSTSEFVQVLKMPSLASVESSRWLRTNCPHEQSGLKFWDDPQTWGGSVPSSGTTQLITLPTNTKVVIRSCSLSSSWTSPYFRIIVPSGSELIFDDANIDIYFKEIYVSEGGKLSVGGPTCRLYSKIRFFFVGTRADSSIVHRNFTKPSKGIISEGETNIFGKQYHPTWTRLSGHAHVLDQVVYLQDAVNWEVGQEIVIVTSRWKDSPDVQENERVKITGIDDTRKTLSVDRPLKFDHYSGPEYQAEVLLLSRRIRFEGSESPAKYGGHTIITSQSIGRFGGIEAVRMGQQNVMARYPFHWHLNNVSQDSSISDCSFHDTYWRCVTIHGSDNVTLSRNVGFNISGHCFYLEDGVEENNVFEYNAVAHVNPIAHVAGGTGTGQIICSGCDASWVTKPNMLTFPKDQLALPADVAASAFYISNAYNIFIGNVASGGWSGFTFINMPKPMGVFHAFDRGYMNPNRRPTLIFNGNTAHSSGFSWGRFGACIYAGGELKVDEVTGNMVYNTGRAPESHPTALSETQPATMFYENTKTYLCALGVQHWGDYSGFLGYESHDSIRGTFLIGSSFVDHGLFNGRSGNVVGSSAIYDRMGFIFYDTFIRQFLNDVTFRNYQGDEPIMRLLTFSMRWLPQGIGAVNNIRFENCPNSKSYRVFLGWCGPLCGKRDKTDDIVETQASRIMAMYDQDGSVSLTKRSTLIGSTRLWWNYRADCTYDEFTFMWYCPYDGKHELAYLDFDAVGVTTGPSDEEKGIDKPDSAYPNQVGYASQFGKLNYSVPFGPFPGVAGPTGTGWYFRPTGGAPKTVLIGKMGMQMRRNLFIVLAIKYPASTKFSIKIEMTGEKNYTVPQKSMSEVMAPTEQLNELHHFQCPRDEIGFCANTGGVGPAYHFNGKFLYVRIVNPVYYVSETYRRSFSMTYKGNTLGEVVRRNVYFIETTCEGCSSASSSLWAVADELPPAFPGQVLKAPPANYNGPKAVGCTTCGGTTNAKPSGPQGGPPVKAKEQSRGGPSTLTLVYIIAASVGACLSLVAVMSCCVWHTRRKKKRVDYDSVQTHDRETV